MAARTALKDVAYQSKQPIKIKPKRSKAPIRGTQIYPKFPVRTEPPAAYFPSAPRIYNWGGGYIGINGGYAFGQSEWGSDPLNPSGNSSTGNFHVKGGLVGATMGVSGQFGAFVLGVEGDFDWQGIKGTSGSPFCTSLITSTAANIFTVTPPLPPVLQTLNAPPAGLSCKTASNWLGTFRARFGYAWDRVLVYGTAGGAGANVQTALSGLPYQTNAEWGWTVGAGVEVALAENWTFKVEYLFVDLGKWDWLIPPQAAPEIGSVANSDLATNVQRPVRNSELPDKSFAASESPSVVQQWLEGVQRLDYVRSPPAVPPIRWQLFLGDCHVFLSSSWAERAATLGWDALALFGCHRTRPLEHLGSVVNAA